MAELENSNLTALTVDLLSAYLSNNSLASEDLAGLVQSTHAALAKIDAPEVETKAAQEYTPAVSIRKSVASPDVIISLIDGKPYKTLKRHLASHGLSIADYRARYNLPPTYPMVAPTYSEHRRKVANTLGLGRKPSKPKTVSVSSSPSPKASGASNAKPAQRSVAKASAPKPAVVKAVPVAKVAAAKIAQAKPTAAKAAKSAPKKPVAPKSAETTTPAVKPSASKAAPAIKPAASKAKASSGKSSNGAAKQSSAKPAKKAAPAGVKSEKFPSAKPPVA